MKKISVSIIGGSGYAGGELLRILLSHPFVHINQTTSQRYVDQPISLIHPNLRGRSDLLFSSIDSLKKCDFLFVALPNGESIKLFDKLKKIAKKIIDLGADFRKKFVYGLAELHRKDIKKAKYVVCGGCEATAIILALYPIIVENIIQTSGTIADVKIGSSAAGNQASASTHHPERANLLRSYKPTNHRHEAEVSQEVGISIEISATAVDMVRGILATIHCRVKKGISEKEIWQAYRKTYKDEPFIRIIKQKQGLYRYPEPKILWGTNFCDIGFEKNPKSDRLVVLSAIDNLVKGTAGQAVQAMNIMFGFPETMALEFPGLHPI